MAKDKNAGGMARREILTGAGVGLAGATGLAAGLPGTAAKAAPDPGTNSRHQALSTPANEVVATRDGRVRGFVEAGVHIFKGIPYAAPTGGSGRWLPPQPVASWSGVYPAIAWGPTCPIGENPQWKQPEFKFLLQWDNGIPGEDCLVLNVWTPAINDGRKRPVMFWLHGGGFSGGSAQELPAYDGANLAKRGDVVVVSINHRLNAFGFLDLSAVGGSAYADSGNAGMLDVVKALQWVRDNIAGFGGDPDNVTIFGQSGGGSKVTALASSPMARGLFKRGIVQSGGGFGRWTRPEDAQRMAAAVLSELGMTGFDSARLAQVRGVDLVAALDRASAKLRAAGKPAGTGPVANGLFLPLGDTVPAQIGAIPMIIGSNATERTVAISEPDVENLDEAGLRARLEKAYPGHADAIIATYRQTRPGARPVEVWASAASWTFARSGSIKQVEQRLALGGDSAHLSIRIRLAHACAKWSAARLPLFRTSVCLLQCRPDASIRRGRGGRDGAGRSDDGCLDRLARTGNPNHRGIPAWKPVSDAEWPTMIFDSAMSIRDDKRSPEINVLRATAA